MLATLSGGFPAYGAYIVESAYPDVFLGDQQQRTDDANRYFAPGASREERLRICAPTTCGGFSRLPTTGAWYRPTLPCSGWQPAPTARSCSTSSADPLTRLSAERQ